MTLESSKTFGGVGAILIAIGSFVFFSGFIGVLSLIGIILVLIAMKGLAEYYNERGIFNNALYGFIFGIIGGIVAIIIFITAFFVGISWETMNPSEFMIPWTFIGSLIIGWIALVTFLIIEAVFYRRSFTLLSKKSEEKTFDTAGLLLLIGAVLTIIVIGVIISIIAWILVAVGFFSLKPTKVQPEIAPPPTPP